MNESNILNLEFNKKRNILEEQINENLKILNKSFNKCKIYDVNLTKIIYNYII